MADILSAPLGLNQAGLRYPAEYLRAQHYSRTSGGNGVDSPRALKVTAQTAPDGTVSVLPGGATLRSTYAGAEGQSYHGAKFSPTTLTIPPTGSSSSGRHDLVVLRLHDPQYGDMPSGWSGGEIPAEEAAEYDYLPFEVLQGKSVSTKLDYPHVKLAHIRRGPNQTVVRPEDIHDLRELADPQVKPHVHALDMPADTNQSVHTGSTVWPKDSTHTAHFPEFATQVKLQAMWMQVHAHRSAGGNNVANGTARIAFKLGSETIYSQATFWNTSGDQNYEHFSIALADTIAIPDSFRGKDVTVEFHATKYTGPNVYVSSNSSTSLIMFFEQGIA